MARIIKAKAWHDRRTVALARALLGKYLVRRQRNGTLDARRITEVEAYHGESDRASHARAGRTKRTEIMYGPGGVWYVYLCYGIHEMLNLVVGPPDHPAAVLIRGVEGLIGPGRLTRGLDIDRRLNGLPAAPASGLWIEDRGATKGQRVQATPRIGVNYAGPIWAAKPWRFVLRPSRQLQPARPRRQSCPAPRRAAAP